MNDLLTAREVQDMLKIDRTTIYRMLKDGRLTGVKIGKQWRFARQEVDDLLSYDDTVESTPPARLTDVLPLHCLQPIQDVFADVAGIGSITIAPDGHPLTQLSNGCQFCTFMQSSPSGLQACIASWRQAAQSECQPMFISCHAGLQYACAQIELDNTLIALLIAGQFYIDTPDSDESTRRIEQLAALHALDLAALAEAARSIPTLDQRTRAKLGMWLKRVTDTFETIGHERSELMSRLRQIAAMSTLDSN